MAMRGTFSRLHAPFTGDWKNKASPGVGAGMERSSYAHACATGMPMLAMTAKRCALASVSLGCSGRAQMPGMSLRPVPWFRATMDGAS